MAIGGDRYYYELMPVFVLFIGAALRGVRPNRGEEALARLSVLSWCTAAAAVIAFAALEVGSYRSTVRLFDDTYLDFFYGKAFFDNLRDGVKRISRDPDGTWPLVDSDIPRDIVLLATNPHLNSELLTLIGEHPKVVAPRPGAYWITRTGHVYRL
jgi:hypothetical protein